MRRLSQALAGPMAALIDQALVSGANFLAVAALARCLPKEDFGRFTLALTVAIALTGVHQSLVLSPQVMLQPERGAQGTPAYHAALERLHLLFIAIAVVAGAPLWFGGGSWPLVAATALAVATRMGTEFQRRAAYTLGDTRLALRLDAVSALPLALGAAWFWFHPHPTTPAVGMLGLAAAATLGWVVGRWVLHRRLRPERREGLRPLVAEHWRAGRILLGSAMLQWVADLAYPFLVAGLLGLRETALLMAARTLMNMGNVLLNGLDAWGTPRLRTAHLAGEGFGRRAWRQGALLVGCMALLALPVALAAGPLMATVFGPTYRDGGWILAAFAGLFVLRAMLRALAMTLIAMKAPGAGFVGTCIGAALTLCAGPWMVAHGGLPGAVAALALNALVMVAALAVGVWRLSPRRRA